MEFKLVRFMIASALAALVGVWNLGEQIARHSTADAGVLQFSLLVRYGILGEPGPFGSIVRGLAFFAPVLIASLAVSRFWAELFARFRHRPLDPGWWLAAWYFALLVPATLPMTYVAVALSFGVVFGCHVFGGTGRYFVNPALLGVVFLAVAYPDLLVDTRWLPGADVPTTWAAVTAATQASATGNEAWVHFVGREIGSTGAPSALACLVGAGVLVALRCAPVGIVAGGIVAVLLGGAAIGSLSAFEHLALGQFAFLLAFVATDTTTRPSTVVGEWAYGGFFGVLVVGLRIANPDHPEGSAFALLLACSCVPLFDEIARRGRSMWVPSEERKSG